jgi:hypothetical protein
MLTRSSRAHHDRQHAIDALQKLLPPSKIIHDDPSWPSPLCQYFAVHHALMQAKHPYLYGSAFHLRMACKQWLHNNYALISPMRPNNVNNELEWQRYCEGYCGRLCSTRQKEYTLTLGRYNNHVQTIMRLQWNRFRLSSVRGLNGSVLRVLLVERIPLDFHE